MLFSPVYAGYFKFVNQMILNVYTITVYFIAAVTVVLGAVLAVFSLRIYRSWSVSLSDVQRTTAENRSYLLLLIATVILYVKLLSWPLFYFTLHSFVPHIHGAMCIFGVTQGQPLLSGIAQVYKPVVFFLIGGWLLINTLDRATDTAPLFRRKFLYLFIASLMVIADSAMDIFYFSTFGDTADVSCCTTFFDLPERTSAIVPASILGENYRSYLMPFYYSLNTVLILSALIFYRSFTYENLQSNKNRMLFQLIILSVISVLNVAVTLTAMFEVIAPMIMELPYHHCIYCMWQYVPDSILMTGLFIAGTFSFNWALLLYLTGRHKETFSKMSVYIKNLCFAGITGILASMVMVSVYLVIKE